MRAGAGETLHKVGCTCNRISAHNSGMKCTIAFFALSLLVVAGCGAKDETTITTPDGAKVTTTEDGGTSVSVDDGKGGKVDLNTDGKGNIEMSDGKGGSLSVGDSLSEADLGVPFYPGSTENKSGLSAKVDTDKETVATSMRTTKDEPGSVLEFYQKHVRNPKMSNTTGAMKLATISGVLESGSEIAVTANQNGSEDTQIVVAVKTKKK